MRILVTGSVFDGRELTRLEASGYEVTSVQNVEGELADLLSDIDIYILAGDEKVTKKDLATAKTLRAIFFFGVQPETFLDPEIFQAVTVIALGENANAVAELTVALILCSLRQLPEMTAASGSGKWSPQIGTEISGKTAGIVGAGKIGSLVAKKLHCLGARLTYCSRSEKSELDREIGAVRQPLEELLLDSQIISLHLPLEENTRGLISREEFLKMGNQAVLINTARPALVDENALQAALAQGRIAMAALDGWYSEGKEFELTYEWQELIRQGKLIITPHQGFNTAEANRATSQRIIERILQDFPPH